MGGSPERASAGDLFPAVASEVAAAAEQALCAARGGSPDGVGRLLEIYRPYLLTIANSELPDGLAGKAAPSDFLQETIVKGFEQFGTFQGSSAEELARWLRQILLNHLANGRKFFLREKRTIEREQAVDARQPDGQQPSPSEEVRRREKRELVEAAIARLPENYRQVIRLRHSENLSFGEIAAIMRNSEDGAQKLWMRAVQALQQQLGGDGS